MAVEKVGENVGEVIEVALIAGLILIPIIGLVVGFAGKSTPSVVVKTVVDAVTKANRSGISSMKFVAGSFPPHSYILTVNYVSELESVVGEKGFGLSEFKKCNGFPYCFCMVYVNAFNDEDSCVSHGGEEYVGVTSCPSGMVEVGEVVVPNGLCCVSAGYRLSKLVELTGLDDTTDGDDVFLTISDSSFTSFTNNLVSNATKNLFSFVKCSSSYFPVYYKNWFVLGFPSQSFDDDLLVTLKGSGNKVEVLEVVKG